MWESFVDGEFAVFEVFDWWYWVDESNASAIFLHNHGDCLMKCNKFKGNCEILVYYVIFL